MASIKVTHLTRLFVGGNTQTIKNGQMLQTSESQNEVYLLYSGFIKRYQINDDGSTSTQIVYGPGSVFSLTLIWKEMFGGEMYKGPEVFYYDAMGDTELYVVDMPKLLAAAKKDPMIYADLFQVACTHLNSCVHSLENLSLKTSYQRVAHQLLYFGWNFSHKDNEDSNTKILLPLTHADLASILSIARETVSRAMADLKKRGLVDSIKDSIVIPDLKMLEIAAYNLD